jgi:hypothetical protein
MYFIHQMVIAVIGRLPASYNSALQFIIEYNKDHVEGQALEGRVTQAPFPL